MLRHLFTPSWVLGRTFTPDVMAAIDAAVAASEARHRGEIRFAVEAGLDLPELMRDATARERAVEVFSRLRVWDTEENTGVLIYVQWLDRQVEIVADRGIARCVPQVAWDGVCRTMEAAFRDGRFGEGSVEAVRAVGDLLAGPFPARPDNPNELPDRPILL
ncbi:TPM domain-containing protein [uncultured Zoogloea sp.]|uniref:TPM domain-containing protein n=1 Tax=uncultured Zoogloea sp. TaxID=160237 RepID=UPI002622E79F|nr:TPM domain-containing protein [uncultured Zoogloea sp.]